MLAAASFLVVPGAVPTGASTAVVTAVEPSTTTVPAGQAPAAPAAAGPVLALVTAGVTTVAVRLVRRRRAARSSRVDTT